MQLTISRAARQWPSMERGQRPALYLRTSDEVLRPTSSETRTLLPRSNMPGLGTSLLPRLDKVPGFQCSMSLALARAKVNTRCIPQSQSKCQI